MAYNKNTLVSAFKFLYCITFFVLLMDRLDNAPEVFFSIFRKIKYVYILSLLIYAGSNIITTSIKKRELASFAIIVILFLHTLLWGIGFVNPTLIRETHVHMRENILLLLFIGTTSLLYSREGSTCEFARHTFICYLLVLIWAGATHISNFVNPVKFVYVLGGEHTYRVTFGLGHANYVGSMCCCALICSIYLLERIRNHKSIRQLLRKREVWPLLVSDIYIGEMLFSTASRTAIVAFLAVTALYIIVNSDELFPVYGIKSARLLVTVIGTIILFILMVSGVFSELLASSHRDSLIGTNYNILVNNYSIWTGMGYINYSGFAFGTWLFGYRTANADSYYAYIFFSTGILGTIIIGIALAILCRKIIKNAYKENFILDCMALISFLIIGITQASVLSYDHLNSYTYWILLLVSISGTNNYYQTGQTIIKGIYENSSCDGYL